MSAATSVMKEEKVMITNISALETTVLKAVFGFAQKMSNVSFPKEVLVDEKILKSNQLNTVLMNLKAKNIIEINLDLFGFSMVSMTFDGVRFCKGLMRKKAAKAA